MEDRDGNRYIIGRWLYDLLRDNRQDARFASEIIRDEGILATQSELNYLAIIILDSVRDRGRGRSRSPGGTRRLPSRSPSRSPNGSRRVGGASSGSVPIREVSGISPTQQIQQSQRVPSPSRRRSGVSPTRFTPDNRTAGLTPYDSNLSSNLSPIQVSQVPTQLTQTGGLRPSYSSTGFSSGLQRA